MVLKDIHNTWFTYTYLRIKTMNNYEMLVCSANIYCGIKKVDHMVAEIVVIKEYRKTTVGFAAWGSLIIIDN